MNEAVRQTLRELIAKYGHGLCDDPRRCEGLLRDLSGKNRREIAVIVGALKEGVPRRLLDADKSIPFAAVIAQLSDCLANDLALSQDAARWATESWALALGLGLPPQPSDDRKKSGGTAASGKATRTDTTADASHEEAACLADKGKPSGKGVSSRGASEAAFDYYSRLAKEKLCERDELEAMIDHCEAVLAVYPGDTTIRAKLEKAIHDKEKAEIDALEYAEAAAKAEEDFNARVDLAESYKSADNLDEAIREYEEAIRIIPSAWPARQDLAEVYDRQGRLDDAERHYKEVLRLVDHALAYCVECCAENPIANPKSIVKKSGELGIQGLCSVCGTEVFIVRG